MSEERKMMREGLVVAGWRQTAYAWTRDGLRGEWTTEDAWKIQGAFSNSERVVDRAESLIEFITEQACYPLPYGGVFRERVQHLIAALAAAHKEEEK